MPEARLIVAGEESKSRAVEVKQNIRYIADSSNPMHLADLYLPRDKTGYPVVVFVHGGNWNSQNKNYYQAIDLLKSSGVKNSLSEIKGLNHSGLIFSLNKNNDQISDSVAKFVFENST